MPRHPYSQELWGQISAPLGTGGQRCHFGDRPRILGTVGTYAKFPELRVWGRFSLSNSHCCAWIYLCSIDLVGAGLRPLLTLFQSMHPMEKAAILVDNCHCVPKRLQLWVCYVTASAVDPGEGLWRAYHNLIVPHTNNSVIFSTHQPKSPGSYGLHS